MNEYRIGIESNISLAEVEARRHFRWVATRERLAGQVFVAGLLDQMCLDLGMDPNTTWREPRRREQLAREYRRNAAALRAEVYYSASVLSSRNADIIDSAA